MAKKGEAVREFFRDIESLPENLLEQWTARLEAGLRGSEAEGLSRAILRDFILRHALGRPQSPVTMLWLADAFDKLIDYGDPYDVLVLPKRAANRPAGPGVQRAIDVACWVAMAMRRGYREPEANNLAAERFSCDVRHVRRMRKSAAGWSESMLGDEDFWEQYFLQKRRPLPPTTTADAKS